MPILFTCLFCKKQSFRGKRKALPKYCSRTCQIGAQKPPVIITCKLCGKQKRLNPSKAKNQKHCSTQCAGKAGRNKIVKNCESCGNPYEVIPAESVKSRFCSRTCKAQWLKLTYSGENSPVWKGGNKESYSRYCKANPEKRAELVHKRRATMRQVNYEKVDRLGIVERDKSICYICGRFLETKEITLDHVYPICKGGEHTERNLRVCCKSCNSRKKDKLIQDFVSFL